MWLAQDDHKDVTPFVKFKTTCGKNKTNASKMYHQIKSNFYQKKSLK